MTEGGECDDEDCPDAFLDCRLEGGSQSRACQSKGSSSSVRPYNYYSLLDTQSKGSAQAEILR